MEAGCAMGAWKKDATWMDGAPLGRSFSTCSTRKRRALRAHELMMQQAERVRHWRGFCSCNRA
ncbi:hypothetical protein KI387_030114, partial [Taxus chinensis]